MRSPRLLWPGLLATALLVSSGSAMEEWTQWRGPGRDGRLTGVTWPESLDSIESRWQVALGPSYSGPIVGEAAVFVTETCDAEIERVRALDRSTGKELWATSWKGALQVPFFAKRNGDWIRSTPALRHGRLYVAGMRDTLVCLDSASGEVLWRGDLSDRHEAPLPTFGCVSSPLLHGEHLYIQAGGGLLKIDAGSGETVWRALSDGGGMNGSAFSSPVIATLGGREQIVVQTRNLLAGVDLTRGDVLWKVEVPTFRGMNILTPTTVGDRVFTSSYGGGSLALQVSESGGEFTAEQLWQNGVQGYMGSPVVIDGHAYLHLRSRRLVCFDLASGERPWTSSERFGEYMSLVSAGDLVLGLDQLGELVLFRASPEKLEILGRKVVAHAETWAHLAVAGDQIYVRSLEGLTSFRWLADPGARDRPAD